MTRTPSEPAPREPSIFAGTTGFERFALWLAAAVVGAAGLWLVLSFLDWPPSYPDFIVGALAWSAETKLQDLAAGPVLVGAMLAAAVLLASATSGIRRVAGEGSAQRFACQLLLWSVPGVLGAARLILQPSADAVLIVGSAVGILALATGLLWQVRRGIPPEPEFVGVAVASAFAVALVPVETGLLLGRMQLANAAALRGVSVWAGILAAAALPLFLLVASRPGTQVVRRLVPVTFALVQLGLLLFYVTLYPARFITPDKAIVGYPVRGWWPFFIGAIILLGAWDVLRRLRRQRGSEPTDWPGLASPLALFGLLLGLRLGVTMPPAIIPGDDYHFGELILGFWSWLHGRLPYVDYLPPHGSIEDDLGGLLSYAIFDGTAATIPEANRVGFALLALPAFLALVRSTGSLALAFVSCASLIAGRQAWLFFTPFLCLWWHASARSRPGVWMATWIVSAPLLILAVPAQGLALVLATAPVAGWMAWRWGRGAARGAIGRAGIVAGVTVGLLLLSPVPRMLAGAVRYVLENGPINQVAHGQPWHVGWQAGEHTGLVFELLRMGWIVAPLVAAVLLVWSWADRGRRTAVWPVAVPTLLFVFLLMAYAVGRIDAGSISRPGVATLFALGLLVPLMIWPLVSERGRALTVVAVAFLVASVGSASVGTSAAVTRDQPWSAMLLAGVTPSWPVTELRDGKADGLHNVGRARVSEGDWRRLVSLERALDRRLRPGEPYLDLTNRSAQYAYVDRPPVIEVPVPYNLVSSTQQRRAIAALERVRPRVALLEAANINQDGGSAALRAPLLYRWVFEHYAPRWEDGLILGIRKEDVSPDEPLVVPIADYSDPNWERGVHRAEAAVLLADARVLAGVQVGDTIRLAAAGERRVTRVWVEGGAVWVHGAALDPSKDGAPGSVVIELGAGGQRESRPAAISDYSDPNWDRGILRSEAALFLDDASIVSLLKPGDRVQLASGARRQVTRVWVEGRAVWLDGPGLDPDLDGAPHAAGLELDAAAKAAWRLRLLDKAFAVPDLRKIPTAWGQSWASLAKQARYVADFEGLPQSLVDLEKVGKARALRVTGKDPHVSFDLSSLALSGPQAGILRFTFACHRRVGEPRLQLFWWGDDQPGPSEAASVRFDGDSGVLIVPLDAYPRWLSLSSVKGIRVDLDDPDACRDVVLDAFVLLQRRGLPGGGKPQGRERQQTEQAGKKAGKEGS